MKVELNIPDDLSEIRLEQYQKYYKLVKDQEPSDFIDQKTLEIFCDIDLRDTVNIAYKDVKEVLTAINDIFKGNHKLIQRFTLAGVEFGLHPDIENMNWDEYADSNLYHDVHEWHRLMAIFYRPITQRKGDKYMIEDYQGTDKFAEVMKHAPLDVVFGLQVFFYNLLKELAIDLADYSTEILKGEMNLQPNLNLLISGDGIRAYTDLHKGMYFGLMLSEN